jgi:hypothetical protein
MTLEMRALLVVVSISIFVAAWMLRIEATTHAQGVGALVTDRWTGTVYSCVLATCVVVYPLLPTR